MTLSGAAGGDRGAFDLLLRRRPLFALVAVWVIGLSSVGAVLVLQHRLDQRRQALVVVADLRKEASDLSPIAFQTTLGVPEPVVRARLALGETQLTASAMSLTRLSGNDADSKRIVSQARPLFALLASANELVNSGHLRPAGLLMLAGVAPGGAIASLRSTFDETAAKYDREAASAKKLADLGTLLTIVLVLLAFSIALRRATRLAAEKHRLLEQSLEDALTDSLTGLGNRRKLFRDIDVLLAEQRSGEKLALGMFDLDGFKAYNDAFGHPAGDALLARLGRRLNAAIAGDGRAYRIGGDEFCVIARGDGVDTLLERAQEALSERNEDYTVSCALGSVALAPIEVTLEEALRVADGRLYLNKAGARTDQGGHASHVLVNREEPGWRSATAASRTSSVKTSVSCLSPIHEPIKGPALN